MDPKAGPHKDVEGREGPSKVTISANSYELPIRPRAGKCCDREKEEISRFSLGTVNSALEAAKLAEDSRAIISQTQELTARIRSMVDEIHESKIDTDMSPDN